MQIIQSPYKVEEESQKANFLEIVSDRYCRGIINAIMNKPKSAMDLAKECHIPISTVYRRIQMLHDSKMLYTTGQISSDGKKFFLYKSKVKEIQAHFNNGEVQVKVIFNQ